MVEAKRIEDFLQGTHPQKYIVAIEAEYNTPKVTLVINDPETGKRLETDTFKPFLWFREAVSTYMYEGKRMKIFEACKKHGVKITKLITSNDKGFSPKRMEEGYKYMATCSGSYNDLINFFKNGGVDVFKRAEPKKTSDFLMFSPTEQYLIQTGKRLFKGIEDYDGLYRFQYDLETEGLDPKKHAIFQIGVRASKNNQEEHMIERVLEVTGNNGYEKRDAEREVITNFFRIIDFIKPDIITGYNSEDFDWNFLFERCERLGMDITDVAITLNRLSKIKRKASTLKLGGETQAYNQTYMYGYNIIDISHAVRRAMAINSEIKAWGLKYITQYSGIAKPNRVYVPGDKINTTWTDKVNDYAFNNHNGDWYKISEKTPLKPNYKIVKGDYIVQRYLCDDLWETEQIDNLFNQASFLIAKMLPTSFMRSSTMGTAGQWKLIMAAWSYENGLAIPNTQDKRDFTGGLSRLLEVGYARNVVKLDYAALYPKTQLTHDIFPDLDITGVMEGMLTYVVDTRDRYKFLTSAEKKKAKKLQEKLDREKNTMSEEEISKMKSDIAEHKRLSNLYDKKQLPLKILANSWFGSYGAPYIFNWGDTDSAEETTCRGRQYLRLMVRHFTKKHGFKALVGDTDGFNFSFPDNIDDIKYVAEGSHWKTIDDAGKELSGLDAILAEFNEKFMKGRMGLDIDDICNSTINFSRKNYANDIGGKIKLVGNSVKSKKMSIYIEEFLGKAIRMLLDGDGHSFIQFYYEFVDKIYNYQIPLVKIASKAKVKQTIKDYKRKMTGTNKNGKPLAKQAHMELAINGELDINIGDTIFYINTGTAKSHGDIKTEKNKETGLSKVNINCKLIRPEVVEKDFELIKELEMLKKALTTSEDEQSKLDMEARIEEINSNLFTDEYNVARYLDALNKKVKPLLVCFNPDIRNNILLDIVKIKDKTTKKSVEKLKDRLIFTKAECELVSGLPFKESDQDSYEELMTMEDKEIRFWDSVGKIPNDMEDESVWPQMVADYRERMRITREEGIKHETERFDKILKHIEIGDLEKFYTGEFYPAEFNSFVELLELEDGKHFFVSKKWKVPIASVNDINRYELEAIERDKYYQLVGCGEDNTNRYQQYLEYIAEKKVMTGDTMTISASVDVVNTPKDLGKMVETIKTKIKESSQKEEPKKKRLSEIEDDDDGELELEETEEGEIVRSDDVIQLDDEVDDTIAENPEDYNPNVRDVVEEPKKDDGWPF